MSQEFAVLCIVFVFSTGVLFWTSGTINRIKDVFGRIGLALLVTTVVRLAMLLFPPAEVQTDVYASTRQEYYDVINDARRSIWICQTWLPDFAIMNSILVDKARSGVDVRLMLSSFRPQSHIFSRIRGRRDIADSLVAMINVYQCATPLFEAGRKECLRFNWGHHPGWIAVIDGRDVFWGQTPVHIDNQGQDFLFHHDTVKGLHGAFWKVQFESMPMITIGKSISTPLSLDERKYTWGDGAGGGTSRVTDLINAIGDAGTKSVNTALYTVLPILVVMLMLFGALEWAYGRFSLMRMFIRWPGLMLASWGRALGLPPVGVLALSQIWFVNFAAPLASLRHLDHDRSVTNRQLAATLAAVLAAPQGNVTFPLRADGLSLLIIPLSVIGMVAAAVTTFYGFGVWRWTRGNPGGHASPISCPASPALSLPSPDLFTLIAREGREGIRIALESIPFLLLGLLLVIGLEVTGADKVLTNALGPVLERIGVAAVATTSIVTKYLAGGTAMMAVTYDLVASGSLEASDLNRFAGFTINPLDPVGVLVFLSAGSRVQGVLKPSLCGAFIGIVIRGVSHLIVFQ